jgi:hypothetical protein
MAVWEGKGKMKINEEEETGHGRERKVKKDRFFYSK